MPKRIAEAVKLIEQGKAYPIEEAVKLARETSKVKFDASIEAHFNLNIDAKKTEQKVRTQANLPHGTGKTLKVAAFVTAAKEKEAKEAGADIVGGEELIKQIKQTEKTDFDIAVAEPAMMKNLGVIAKTLGQRKLMPTPKTGTVGPDVGKIIKELKAGKIDIKTDDSGNIHQILGKVSFEDSHLVENFNTLKQAIMSARPSGIKSDFVRSITISSSMGPGIRVLR
jgi:large subunit ribosomal protein L1